MVKRYDMREFDDCIERYEDGSLVSYADYAALAERCERLEAALRMAREELGGLPHSLGYDFTHLPKIDAALSGSSGGKDR